MSVNGIDKMNKSAELPSICESLKSDVAAKDREIRRLALDLQQCEQALRTRENVAKVMKDAEVMAGMCCTGAECGALALAGARDLQELLRAEAAAHRERIASMELSLQSSGEKLRAVHKMNLGLIEELGSLRQLVVAIDVERRDARVKLDLQRAIVKQMVRQLRQAKAQRVCVCACACLVATSTPNATLELELEPSPPPPRPPSPMSTSEGELKAETELVPPVPGREQGPGAAADVHEQTTLRLDTSDLSLARSDAPHRPPDLSLARSDAPHRPLPAAHPLASGNNSPRDQTGPLRPLYSSGTLSNLPDDSSLSLIRGANQECDRSADIQNLSSTDLPRCPGRYIIPTSKSSILETLHPGSMETARNESKNLTPDSRQTGSNRSDVQTPGHSTRARTDSKQSNEQYQSSEEPNQIEQIQGDRDFPQKPESDRKKSVRSQCEYCECPCKELKATVEYLRKYGKNEKLFCEECRCTCTCEHVHTCDRCCGTSWDSRLDLQSEQIMENTLNFDRNYKKLSNQLQSGVKSTVTPNEVEASIQEPNTSRTFRQVRFCPSDESGACGAGAGAAAGAGRRWLVTAEGILRGLDALRHTFMGTNENYTSIYISKTGANHPSTSNREDARFKLDAENGVPVIDPSGSNTHSRDIPRWNSGGQHEETCTLHQTDEEVQTHERADKTYDEMFQVESAAPIPGNSTTRDSLDQADRSSETLEDPRRIGMKLQKSVSAQDSGSGSACACAGACGRYYRDKLLATLQILENKDETIRVQGSSLGVAEGRIAELNKRASDLRHELDHKAQELSQLRQLAESYRGDKTDVSVSAEIKEEEGQRRLAASLRGAQSDLAGVAELYRECFYEAAKQEEMIDMLRKSYLDVRLMERAKADKITKLQGIINTQKRSIEQCQDVVSEVESLKSEISSFLNSSNNDSGMWERGSESPEVGEELADILEQLRQLQDLLTADCTCGMEEECSSLKERNRSLEAELEQVRQRNKELDESLRHILSQQYETRMKEKEREVEELLKKLAEAENICTERGGTCDTLKRQLQQVQVLLDDKTAELVEAQKTSATKDATIRDLHRNLEQSEKLIQEGLRKLSEVAQSRSALVLESQARVSELQQRLQHTARRCRQLEAGCRERERSTSQLQACLEEAHARGAKLCEESRRVTAGVRQWMRDKKLQTREQQDQIRMQKLKIQELERRVRTGQGADADLTSQSETEPSSNSQCDSDTFRCTFRPMCRSDTNPPRGSLEGCIRASETSVLRGSRAECTRGNETASCSKCASNRQGSESEMASCSRAPVPPARKKRQQSYNDLKYASTSRASRSGAQAGPDVRWTSLYGRVPRAGSGHGRGTRPERARAGDVLARVEQLHAALVDGQKRWGRPPHRR